MFTSTKKFIAFAALAASLVGCGAKPAETPVAPKTAAPQPEPPKFDATRHNSTPPFTFVAIAGWSLVNYVALPGDAEKPQLVAIFENDLDEELSVRAGVIAANLTAQEADSFLEDVRDEALSRETAKVFKERIFRLAPELRAYEMIEGRVQPSGPQIFVTLAVTDGKVGYVVSCGGDFEQAERVVPVCAEFVEGFRIVGK